MRFDPPLVSGKLIKREKRFLVHVQLDDGRRIIAHTNNTGSMMGCNIPGSRVWLSPADNPKRKLKWTWELVEAGDPPGLVGINTILANRLVSEAVTAGLITGLTGYDWLQREVRCGERSRIDLLLGDGPRETPTCRCWVEVKNVTLVENGRALFPDAPTERGRRHLEELTRLVAEGDRACMFYLVQRGDAETFAPAESIDPLYAEGLRRARGAGVEVLAYRADISPEGIGVGDRLAIDLEEQPEGPAG